MTANSTFIIHGVHLSENLQHHKMSDVRRILEDKGFGESGDKGTGDALHFVPASGTSGNDITTTVHFDDAGFVRETDGVQHS